MCPNKSNIAIVNAYDKDGYFIEVFKEGGASLFHIQSDADESNTDILPRYRGNFNAERFNSNIIFDGDLNKCKSTIRDKEIDYVIAGGEYGVELAEALGPAAKNMTNDPRTTSLRRNKFQMNQALRNAGLPAVRQALCDSEECLDDFFISTGGEIVVKPLNSGLNDNVYFCSSIEEARHAFHNTIGKTTIFGETIKNILLQEYLGGREYMVNTVSRKGVHHVAEIWEKSFVSANGVLDLCDTISLISPVGEIQSELISFTFDCLNALGVTDSPAHVEIRYIAEGPRLIELGARRAGCHMSRISKLALAETQFDWIAKSYLDLDLFLKEAGRPYELVGTVASTSLISRTAGQFEVYKKADEIQSLPSFDELIITAPRGSYVHPTTNDSTYIGYVVLYGTNPAAVERDARTVRYIDSQEGSSVISKTC